MTWTLDLGTAIPTWVQTEAPKAPLVLHVAIDWVKELRAHGPYDAPNVGSVVMTDPATGLVVLSLSHVEFPQVFIEMRVTEETRSISLLSVSTGRTESR